MNIIGKKNVIALILSFVLCMTVAGCVSDDEFDELEERVTKLENQVSDPAGLDNSFDAETNPSELGNNDTNNGNSLETNEVTFLYIIDSLSAKEKIEEIKSCISNMPYRGESYEEYANNFKILPQYDSSNDSQIEVTQGLDYCFYVGSEDNYVYVYPDEDVILKTELRGVYSQMDGTINYGQHNFNQEYISIKTVVIIHDYDEAVEMYNQLYEYLSSYYSKTSNNTESTNWSGSGSIQINEFSTAGINFVNLSKGEDYYILSATYAYVPEQ